MGAELRGNSCFRRVEESGINVPLCVAVDYLGFRLKCVAALPLLISKYSDSGRLVNRGEKLVVRL